ncbi:hypothetical protein ACFOQM_04470 [Paenibacillus sp. GCM10012307]|uniref:Uncharacterized protein n=1 Tax=Paenibacillus roseus TaxID=2798579 RepID=A0A934MK25_9BACL|nr:hypothetical protein [Paenibacillus roseus]MBJ6360565.1 hypothetical protein [Paenibacillus roseus]
METYKDRVRLLRREVYQMGKKVERKWEKELLTSEHICFTNRDIPLRKYIDDVGGFRIMRDEWSQLPLILRDFFAQRAHFDKRYVIFRGYDYYKFDPTIHLPASSFNENMAWFELVNRWMLYASYFSKIENEITQPSIFFPTWLASLSYFEWIFNDLCSMRWTGLCIECYYHKENESVPKQILKWIEAIEHGLEVAAQMLIDVGYRRWKENPSIHEKSKRLKQVLQSSDITMQAECIGELIQRVGANGWVRSIREGDQLWIVCSMFENKVIPLLPSQDTPLHILSNAFGGIHIGYLWKAMLLNRGVLKVQQHVIRTSVHEAEMNRMKGLYETLTVEKMNGIIIHTDDSIFSGKTHKRVLNLLMNTSDPIHFVPLTLDIGTIYNHPEELTSQGMPINECIDQIEQFARGIDGYLPVARSYWAIKKIQRNQKYESSNPHFKKIVDGSDRLVGMLWNRFSSEILKKAGQI